MSTTPKMTMIGLYNYNNALFDNVDLPEEIDKSDFINTFMLNYGEYPVIYPAWDIMKFALGVWSKKWYHSIERIILAMTEDYNPLHNFDRYEKYTDAENKREKNETTYGATDTLTHGTTNEITYDTEEKLAYNSSITETDSREIDTDGTTTNEVSAYNESTYQPDSKTTIDNTETHSGDVETEKDGYDTTTKTGTDTTAITGTEKNEKTGKDTNDMTGNRGFSHDGHLYGNIGVTESTTMLMHEIETRSSQNILDIVAEMLFKEVCIFTY